LLYRKVCVTCSSVNKPITNDKSAPLSSAPSRVDRILEYRAVISQFHSSSVMASSELQDGWTAVPRSLDKLIASRKNPQSPEPIKIEELSLPNSPLVDTVTKYARDNLPGPAFNHSMRVFYFGQAITKQHFPEWNYSLETWLLACLLHDIGTTDANMNRTQMSFEFQGGMLAHKLLIDNGASQSQAEAVAETIIRHQDVGDTGNVSTLTAVIHFGTLFDNAGGNAELVHKETIESVVKAWPREKWTGCFASVIRSEVGKKPWSHTTKIEGFAEMVEANKLMEPYD